ncbi:MAG: phospholipase D-like domain-containing protein [Synergistaceae bacterium]
MCGDFAPGNVRFIRDLTYVKEGKTVHEPHILREEIALINKAEKFILTDMFLFNDTYNKNKDCYPNASDSLMLALIEKKKSNPNIEIVFITDPYNEFYGSYKEKHLKEMENNGIITIVTDLDKMRDSNPLYSGFYRVYLKWLGTGSVKWIPNPMDSTAPNINIRSLLKLLNLKANHRKTLCTDKGAIVSSANPHDPSFYHSNVAVFIESDMINDIIESERAVAKFSGIDIPKFEYKAEEKLLSDNKIRLLTDGAIGEGLKENIDKAEKGDTINIGIFYISEFELLSKLGEASHRGANVKIIADPNKDAFGMKKNGRPNREALTKLKTNVPNVEIKWYNTTGEQYHAKIALFEFEDSNTIILGSGNYTRRNIDAYNMESDVEIRTSKNSEISQNVTAYFDMIWNNKNGIYTVNFDKFKKESKISYLFYIVQEALGLCSW